MADQFAITAPAKVNLYLAVGGRRPDGYHDVVTVLQALSIHDTVVVRPGGPLSVVTDPDLGLSSEANLAHTAASALARELGREADVTVWIEKRIPAGAGLGGGSSDAAATIVGLAALWGSPADDPALARAARAVGADVPFFLAGGTALLGGRGDEPRSRLATPPLHMAVVWPGVTVPTVAAYAAFDRMLTAPAPGPDAQLAALAAGDPEAVAAALFNNMTEASRGLAPEVGEAVALLEAADGCLGAAMAGSGSAAFGIFAGPRDAEHGAQAARERGWWASSAETVDAGARIVSPAGPDMEDGA